MSKSKDKLGEKMEKLATELADSLIGNTPPPSGKMQAFKILTGYFTATRKLGSSSPKDADTGGFTFDGAKRRLNGNKAEEIEQ